MNNLGGYPVGADKDSKAPWNLDENPEVEIDVTVSITLSKTVKVKVTDYDIIDEGVDDDGNYYRDEDFSDTNLLAAVEEQVILPHEASLYVDVGANLKAANDLSGWHVDDIACIKE